MTNEKAKSYLLGIAEGEKGALSGFVSTVSGRVRYIADGILHDSSLADDVLSIVIERVWQKAPLLARLKNPLGYINTIAYKFRHRPVAAPKGASFKGIGGERGFRGRVGGKTRRSARFGKIGRGGAHGAPGVSLLRDIL